MIHLTAFRRATAGALLGLAFAVPAHAQKPLDWALGGIPPKEAPGEKLMFRVGESSGLQLVPREDGAAPNDQPRTIDPAVLRQQLLLLTYVTPKGAAEPLFSDDEAGDLSGPLAKAFAIAKPTQDVLLFSSSRRDSYFTPPVGLSARLFLVADKLNVIVAQPRIEYYGQWRINSSVRPEFVFGSRTKGSATKLQAPEGVLTRNDWGVLPLVAVASAPARPAPPALAPAPLPVPTQAAPAVAPAPVAPAAAPAPSADPEARLRTLKRLRDGGLISEEEFQQKKAEILKTL
ncbi:MAG: SHOCT domain-containing protein [Rhizobacter sp.]